ncbi:hypothetical protein [Mesorhizobium xinjiangense]|nr:hypothetical protein [Mesorhizobium xinjiangense]
MSLIDAIRRTLFRLRQMFGNGYRPELHYMRGPGPASRDKPTGADGNC